MVFQGLWNETLQAFQQETITSLVLEVLMHLVAAQPFLSLFWGREWYWQVSQPEMQIDAVRHDMWRILKQAKLVLTVP